VADLVRVEHDTGPRETVGNESPGNPVLRQPSCSFWGLSTLSSFSS
jgi:hypothetical protein